MKLWKAVTDNGMDIWTYVVLAETAEQAAQKTRNIKAEEFVEVTSGVLSFYENRWPEA